MLTLGRYGISKTRNQFTEIVLRHTQTRRETSRIGEKLARESHELAILGEGDRGVRDRAKPLDELGRRSLRVCTTTRRKMRDGFGVAEVEQVAA